MVGRKRSRCSPSLYRSLGFTLEVNTSATPRLSSALEQIGEDHRVGDVGDEQLVETDDARLLRDLVGHAIERRLHALEALEVGVHFLHEAVEMRAALRASMREARVEEVHEPGLAAADAAPQVDAARRAGVVCVSPRSRRLPSGAEAASASSARSRSRWRTAASCALSAVKPRLAIPAAYSAPRTSVAAFTAAGS